MVRALADLSDAPWAIALTVLFGVVIFAQVQGYYGCVQKVCTRNGTSLRRRRSCNAIVTNVEVQDTDFLDTPIWLILIDPLCR